MKNLRKIHRKVLRVFNSAAYVSPQISNHRWFSEKVHFKQVCDYLIEWTELSFLQGAVKVYSCSARTKLLTLLWLWWKPCQLPGKFSSNGFQPVNTLCLDSYSVFQIVSGCSGCVLHGSWIYWLSGLVITAFFGKADGVEICQIVLILFFPMSCSQLWRNYLLSFMNQCCGKPANLSAHS
jgi:hypothetical protein